MNRNRLGGLLLGLWSALAYGLLYAPLLITVPVSYTHLTLPTIYSV